MTEVLIGIQARSTSKRLPGKCLEIIDQNSMTEHVLTACHSSAMHINRTNFTKAINCSVALLIPFKDKLKAAFPNEHIVEEDEDDVLARYHKAMEEFNADYVVRITSDCPLMSPPLITKHIMCAVKERLDFCSNVYDGCRTFIDGLDVEVISRKLLIWLHSSATDAADREHVTTYFKKHPPLWAKIGSIIGHIDLSDVKLSVDTLEELNRVRENRKNVMEKVTTAQRLGHTIFRF